MWLFFDRISSIRFSTLLPGALLLFSLISFSNPDTSRFNPFFRDSILTHHIDSAKWNAVLQSVDIHKPGKGSMIQHQKSPAKSKAFLYIFTGLLLILLILRLIFDDFSFSLLEGMFSIKKFFIYYKSKKYDSFLAVLSIYLLKNIILSMITYIGLQHLLKNDFTSFQYAYLLDIIMLLGIFFTAKNVLEFLFNTVIDTQATFKAFFLQNLFTEFVLSVILLVILLIYVYNDHLPYGLIAALIAFSFFAYIVFNIIRSYQLMGNVHIPYKLHFFLYICAFKILPLLLLAKYILSNVG